MYALYVERWRFSPLATVVVVVVVFGVYVNPEG
jgi:hypothetical protein